MRCAPLRIFPIRHGGRESRSTASAQGHDSRPSVRTATHADKPRAPQVRHRAAQCRLIRQRGGAQADHFDRLGREDRPEQRELAGAQVDRTQYLVVQRAERTRDHPYVAISAFPAARRVVGERRAIRATSMQTVGTLTARGCLHHDPCIYKYRPSRYREPRRRASAVRRPFARRCCQLALDETRLANRCHIAAVPAVGFDHPKWRGHTFGGDPQSPRSAPLWIPLARERALTAQHLPVSVNGTVVLCARDDLRRQRRFAIAAPRFARANEPFTNQRLRAISART